MNYHSTMGSRTFMKFLRLEKAGHDLDEVKSLPTAQWKRPWWVQWSDEPTIEVDWDRKERFDETKVIQGSFDKYAGEEESKRVAALKNQWSGWQTDMENDYERLNNLEKDENLGASSKITMWDQFLATYLNDNPYTQQDELLRQRARDRKDYWKNTVTKRNARQSQDVSVINNSESNSNYEQYKNETPENMTFIGRCGMYAYLDMHQAVNSALATARKFLS